MAYVNNPAAFVPAAAAAAAAAAAQGPPPQQHAPHPGPPGSVVSANPNSNLQAAQGQQPGMAAAHGGAAATSSLALLNMSNLINQKDSRWLQLETCREFQRNKCSRSDNECKFAHPTSNVEVQNGRVTACYDSIKVCLYLVCFCLSICLSVLIECHQKAGISVLLERNNYVKQGKAKKARNFVST